MMTNLWETVNRHIFITKLIEMSVIFPHIPLIAEAYQVGTGKCAGKMRLRKGRYEWEFSDVGAYRFRDVNCGPWSKWRCVET